MLPEPPGLTLAQVEKPPPGRVATEICIWEHMPPHIALTWHQLEVDHFWVSHYKPAGVTPFVTSQDSQETNSIGARQPQGSSWWQRPRAGLRMLGVGNWGGGEGHEGSAPREEK